MSSVLHHVKKPKPTALITGASVGIGEAIAKDLVQNHYNIVITARRKENLLRLSCECDRLASNSCRFYVCDLEEDVEVDKLIEFIKNEFGYLDLLINNACWRGSNDNINTPQAINHLSKVLKINLIVPLSLVQKSFQHLKRKGGELTVINISSSASQVVVPLHCYNISKSCLSQLTKSLAKLSQQITAITVSPGPVVTEDRPEHANYGNYTLSNRVANVKEISSFVMMVVKNRHLFNGKELFVDGGQTSMQMSPYRITN